MTLVQQLGYFLQCDIKVIGLRQQSVHALGQEFAFFALGKRGWDLGDICSRPVAFGDQAGAFQLQVSPRHGVGIDDELFGQHADGRNLLAGSQPARRREVLHLIDNLEIDRNPIMGIDMNLQKCSVVGRILLVKVYDTTNTHCIASSNSLACADAKDLVFPANV